MKASESPLDEARLRELAADLRRKITVAMKVSEDGVKGVKRLVNPQGPAAATAIETLLAALSAERERGDRAQIRVAEAYQVIGVVSDAGGLFEHPDVQRALTYFSDDDPEGEILPFSLATQKAEGA